MNLNVQGLIEIIQKATMRFAIDNVSIEISKDKIVSKMTNNSKNVMTILNLKNEIFSEMTCDEIIFNFSEPHSNVIPYLKLIDSETVEIEPSEEKVKIKNGKQKVDLFYCSEHVLTKFGSNGPRSEIEYFYDFDVNDEIKSIFKKLKVVSSRSGKVYFSVNKKKVLFETKDNLNKYSNKLSFEIGKIDVSERNLAFDSSNINHLFSIIGNREDFSFHLTYVEDKKAGMLYCYNSDKSEQYMLMSIIEE